jgi:membrane-associated phospholipid phosphatase
LELVSRVTPFAHRVYTYVALAMNDATIAAWDSKYFYNRARPSDMDHKLATAAAVPNSPSYPSEHSATAWAAATVLAHLLPSEGPAFLALADQAGKSRVLAGLQFPSDDDAGAELGRRVAEQVIARADADGSALPPFGTRLTGTCNWVGGNPGNFGAQNWQPIVLAAPNQFRPPAPPDCSSSQVVNETLLVHNTPRGMTAFATNYKAFYWQSPEGLNTWPYRYADKWMSEDGTTLNPPRAARIYALIAATQFDAFIASQDGKFTYWYIRPSQLDPGIFPLFPVPPFPSYPSNHSTFSAARAEILAYLFPTRAETARAIGKEGGDSRIWAGIHYPMDNVAGVNLGHAVAAVFISRAEHDGSQ